MILGTTTCTHTTKSAIIVLPLLQNSTIASTTITTQQELDVGSSAFTVLRGSIVDSNNSSTVNKLPVPQHQVPFVSHDFSFSTCFLLSHPRVFTTHTAPPFSFAVITITSYPHWRLHGFVQGNSNSPVPFIPAYRSFFFCKFIFAAVRMGCLNMYYESSVLLLLFVILVA